MDTVGRRIKAWRRRRNGMSQKALAGLSGLSQPYISQIESGHRPLDRKSTQVAIAGALNISVTQLLGDATLAADPLRDRALAYVPAIRSALVELAHGERPAPTRDRDAARAATHEVTEKRNAADCIGVAAMLPSLIGDLSAYGDELAPELVETLVGARFALKVMGQTDLSREATQLGVAAMRHHDDLAWRGYAQFVAAQALPPENADLAAKISQRTAGELEHSDTAAGQEVYGMLHLAAALSDAVTLRRDDAAAHLNEAESVARSLGDPERWGQLSAGKVAGMWFGPANVAFWRMAVAAELGHTGVALSVAEQVELDALPVPNRHVYYWTDLARALVADGRDREAMIALGRAERSAPQQFRFSPITRDLVSTLIGRARRRAVSAELIALARSLGLDPL